MKHTVLLVASLLAACGTVPEPDPNDPFVFAATSWEGGSIDGMIEAWGPPNRLLRQPKGDRVGTAEWAFFPPGRRERCIVTASFNTTRTIGIVRVREIPESRRGQCGRSFANNIDGWTRSN